MIDDGTHQHFKSGGRAKAGAGQDGGLAIGIESFHFATQLDKAGSHAANESRGGVDLLCHGFQNRQVHLAQRIALREDADHIGAIKLDSSYRLQIHSARQNATTLMIGVVAADFRTTGGGEIALRRSAKGSREACIQRKTKLMI